MAQEWDSLLSFDPKEPYLWDGHGTNLATCFHPHIFECRHPRKMSAIEFFSSDQAFRRGIEKLLCLYGPEGANDSTIREICRNEAASSRINNFPPRVAKAIIKALLGNRRALVLDPCAGFSGRLLGVSSCGLSYHGIDLSPHTYEGLKRTADFVRSRDPSAQVRIINGDCLDVMPAMTEKFDLVLTSPPFLDMEQYKDVPFQTNYPKWYDSFVKPFITACADRIVDGGILALYLERIRSRNFPDDVTRMAELIGLKPRDPVRFRMSYGENNRGSAVMRTANVLVFTK
jgi:tRNA G10  N-methylase Trm11